MKLRYGFTVIELLVVIAIISILSSTVLASLSKVRNKAGDSKRVQEVIQIVHAAELYNSSEGHYPCSVWHHSGMSNFMQELIDKKYLTGKLDESGGGDSPYINPTWYGSYKSSLTGSCGALFMITYDSETPHALGTECGLLGGNGIWATPYHCHFGLIVNCDAIHAQKVAPSQA